MKTDQPNLLLIVLLRLTRRWENETKFPSVLNTLLLSTGYCGKRAAGVA
jgi:hypothetical protein